MVQCRFKFSFGLSFIQESYFIFKTDRAGTRAVNLGGQTLIRGGPKFEIKHKSRCFQKQKLVIGGGQACRLGGQASLPPPLGDGPEYGLFRCSTFGRFCFITMISSSSNGRVRRAIPSEVVNLDMISSPVKPKIQN